jgi:molecular chaperone Hsp33
VSGQDQIQRFIFDEFPIRGEHVSLHQSWQQIVSQSDAEGPALMLLGEALCATALLVNTLKIEGSIRLQIRGSGPIHLLVAEAYSDNSIRGVVRQNKPVVGGAPLADLFQTDKLVITINSGKAKPHQGIVSLTGNNLSEALQAYFDYSEQLPTRLWLAVDEKNCRGLLIQKLPGDFTDTDAWSRIGILTDTITSQELLETDAKTLLRRLYHQEVYRLFDIEPLRFSCSCSLQRTQDMLFGLGEKEVNSILEEQDNVSITCEFCNKQYSFGAIDIKQLFKSIPISPEHTTRH